MNKETEILQARLNHLKETEETKEEIKEREKLIKSCWENIDLWEMDISHCIGAISTNERLIKDQKKEIEYQEKQIDGCKKQLFKLQESLNE
jgi:hypothetical protein